MHLATLRARVLIPASQPEGKGELKMLITKKMLLVLTLVGALVGAGIGSLITHTAGNSPAANSQAANSYNTPQTASLSENPSERTPDQIAAERSSQFSTAPERTAYRQGFDEDYSSCTTAATNSQRQNASYTTV